VAYLNQPWFNRKIINTIAMATGAVDSETLTVIKRASKQPQQIPVTPVDVDGVKYLVSARGESRWVKNVRNNPNVTLTTKSGTTNYVVHETPVENRQPIIDAYTLKAGKVVKGYFASCPILPTIPSSSPFRNYPCVPSDSAHARSPRPREHVQA
jgi:hypothetical protein